MKKILLIPLFIFLYSCSATPYQKMNSWDGLGYEEVKIGPNKYQLTYLSNALTSMEITVIHWHTRAGELCGGNDKYISEFNEEYKNNIDMNNQGHRFPRVIGIIECKI